MLHAAVDLEPCMKEEKSAIQELDRLMHNGPARAVQGISNLA